VGNVQSGLGCDRKRSRRRLRINLPRSGLSTMLDVPYNEGGGIKEQSPENHPKSNSKNPRGDSPDWHARRFWILWPFAEKPLHRHWTNPPQNQFGLVSPGSGTACISRTVHKTASRGLALLRP
jgi:hypothetical protein